MAVLICILIFLNTPDHSENGFIVFFYLKNIGVDTLVVSLSVLLTELYLIIHLSVMAAQICIKIALGTFFQLVDIAYRLSKVDTLIRSIFPRVLGNPIFRLDYSRTCYEQPLLRAATWPLAFPMQMNLL